MDEVTFETEETLEKDKSEQELSPFQKFLLSAPTMSDKEYNVFLKNRKKFNHWRKK